MWLAPRCIILLAVAHWFVDGKRKTPLSANCRQRRSVVYGVCCMGALLIAPFVVTVPLLYQNGMDHHVFSLSFMHLEKQEI